MDSQFCEEIISYNVKPKSQNSIVRNIVKRQKISTVKKQAAKTLRNEMTPAEKLLWKRLRGNRLAGLHFRRQQIIDGAIVDFYCHRFGLIVELDGDEHMTKETYDRARDEMISRRGLKVIRFNNTDVAKNIEGVLEKILDVCESLKTNPSTGFK